MSKHLTITILTILLALLVLPQAASAARFPFEGPLVPCGRCEEWQCEECKKPNTENPPYVIFKKESAESDIGNECNSGDVCVKRSYDFCFNPRSPGVGDPCNVCHFFLLAQNIINGFITIILAMGTVMIGIGGFIILTSGGVPEQSSHGKKVITYTIIGLLVAFMSWMVINETMLLLVGTETGVGEQKLPWPWDKVECIKYFPTGEGVLNTPAKDKYYISELL